LGRVEAHEVVLNLSTFIGNIYGVNDICQQQ
jgi:hypothetical protein